MARDRRSASADVSDAECSLAVAYLAVMYEQAWQRTYPRREWLNTLRYVGHLLEKGTAVPVLASRVRCAQADMRREWTSLSAAVLRRRSNTVPCEPAAPWRSRAFA
jgi:hypothetical protein